MSQSIQIEVAELLKTVLFFENEIKITKKELFQNPKITPEYIWYSIAPNYELTYKQSPNKIKLNKSSKSINKTSYGVKKQKIPLTPKCLALFLNKHGQKISTKQLKALMNSYSSYCSSTLSVSDLWEIFVPRDDKYVRDIIEGRTKSSYYFLVRCEQPHYQVKDLLIQILVKTIEFENVLQKLKKNILVQDHINFNIGQINPKNLQLYISKFAPQIRTSQAEIILKCIYKNKAKIGNQKVFYDFFIPSLNLEETKNYRNPNKIYNQNNNNEEVRLLLSDCHQKISKFGKIGEKNKAREYLGSKYKLTNNII